jgi:hypothetical protein
MNEYSLLPVNFSLALPAIDFVKTRLKECGIGEDAQKELGDIEDILHRTRKESITLEQQVWQSYMDRIKSALTVYHDYGEHWVSDSNEFRETQKEIENELGRKIYENRDDILFNEYINCFEKEVG